MPRRQKLHAIRKRKGTKEVSNMAYEEKDRFEEPEFELIRVSEQDIICGSIPDYDDPIHDESDYDDPIIPKV